jgi:hypothetical protein
MTKSQIYAREMSRDILINAESHNQRTGQYLFNGLPDEVRAVVAGKGWDPFYKQMSQYQLVDWITRYLVFDDNGKIIGVISGTHLLWGDRQ